jgi:hypothetical protein|tara:strand:- start:37 stop:543 length:507 start_codon:yes stop_codon:yes gene_type:complete
MGHREREHWVFAFGSNLNRSDLERWLAKNHYDPKGILALEPALLRDFSLVWDYRSPVRRGGAANVVPATSQVVYGGLLRVDEPTLYALDHKEGHPERYCRGEEPRLCEYFPPSRPPVSAWLYEVQPAFKEPAFTAPRRVYRDVVVQGASELGLPEDWIAMLRATPTLD